MFKKIVLMSLVAMFIVFGASASQAYQAGGMASSGGPVALNGAHIAPGGLGDALLYNYFNVRGNVNIFNIVNTSTTDGIKVRVIFKEAKDSPEILDFFVCLSRGDVWTAYIADDGTSGRVYANYTGLDTDTIVAPTISSSGVPFAYGANNPNKHIDNTLITADDTREGYFEVVGFSMIPSYDKNSSTTTACSSTTYGGTATNCIRSESACNDWNPTAIALAPADVLAGTNTIIESATLGTYAYKATAFAQGVDTPLNAPLGNYVSIATTLGCGLTDWLLMKEKVSAPYDIWSTLGGETEVNVLFPTRRDCHDWPLAFDRAAFFDCDTDNSDTSTCGEFVTRVSKQVWNEREQNIQVLGFSPQGTTGLPYELNVLKIGGSNIWNSGVALGVDASTYTLGWGLFDFGTVAASANHLMYLCADGTYTWAGTTCAPSTIAQTSSGLPLVSHISQSFQGSAATYMIESFSKTNIN